MVNRNLNTMYLILVFAATSLAASVDYHDTLDDYHDFEGVISNLDLLKEHLNCYVYKGPCTDVMLSYRQHIADFIPEICARCNPPQKHMLKVWLDGLEKVYPEGFNQYVSMYDPDYKYIPLLKEKLKDA